MLGPKKRVRGLEIEWVDADEVVWPDVIGFADSGMAVVSTLVVAFYVD